MNNVITNLLKNYSMEIIENSTIKLFLDRHYLGFVFVNKLINTRIQNIDNDCYEYISKNIDLDSLEKVNTFFESLLSENEKIEKGIVFTPEYICDYIVKNTIKKFENNTKIIDPSCGCGIFIISLLNYLKRKSNKKIIELLEQNIYGIDITKDNIERAKIILTLYAIINGEDKEDIKFNFIEADSLFTDWNLLFKENEFDYIIGNPPYINNHDLKSDYIEKLSSNFQTTTEGTFNIFYAFIEQSMKYLKKDGKLGYIVPNNFIHIQSAKPLRKFIKDNKYLNRIIDFKDNTIFYPTLTYNCILFLSNNNNSFSFAKIEKKSNIRDVFKKIEFKISKTSSLKDDGWELVDEKVKYNISKIESFDFKLDKYIRVGIATLRDKVYIIDGYDDKKQMYYKIINNKKYYIENDLIFPYVKVSKYKTENDLKHIIFPYRLIDNNAVLISYDEMKNKYPNAFNYFEKEKETLCQRNFDNKQKEWYQYGRSQGLNLWDDKILFSTFNESPNFFKYNSKYVLFSNGYCIMPNKYNVDILLKILNSNIMKYYIDNTSYSISGNFKCYQKKYIKNFSIPNFNTEEIEYLNNTTSKIEIEKFLIEKYGLVNFN